MNWSEVEKAKQVFPLTPFDYPIIKDWDKYIIDSIKETDIVLNYGCGRNDLSQQIKCKKFIRLDIDTSVKPDYTKLSQIKTDIDIVFARNLIEHLTLEEIKEFFSWCKKHSKHLMFNSPNAWASYGVFANDYTHKSLYNTRAYGGLLTEAGFSKIKFYRIFPGRFSAIRNPVAKFISLDYTHTIGVDAE